MIDGLVPYPEYKDAGTPWLERVPQHWAVPPNRASFREINERGFADEDLLSVTIKRGVIRQSELLANTSKKDSSNTDKSNYKLVEPGDLVYNKMRAWQGACGVSVHRGIVSPAYIVLRPRGEQMVRYFHYLFRTPAFTKEAERWSYGISSDQWSLRIDEFKRIRAPVPPLNEQASIVRFLDHVDRHVQRYIRAKRQLIALLNEQKQAVIHQAVTRGLDPHVRLKPSCVEWLGDVPEHWEVRRLKTLLERIDQGVSPQAEARLAENGAWGVLKSGCVNHGIFRGAEHKRLPDGFVFDQDLAIREGDVLVSRACGSPKLVGSCGRVRELLYRLILSDKTFRLVFEEARFAEFAVLAMNSRYFRWQVEQAISGAEGLANNLPLSSLRNFLLIVPPIKVAERLAATVCRHIERVAALITRATRDVYLMLEYRTRLIADVVTGKLDVRDATARLPDDVDELDGTLDEVLDDAKLVEDADVDAETEEVAV